MMFELRRAAPRSCEAKDTHDGGGRQEHGYIELARWLGQEREVVMLDYLERSSLFKDTLHNLVKVHVQSLF